MNCLRPRRPLRLAAYLVVLSFTNVARAALWQTEAELTAQYGEPVDIRRDSDGRKFTWASGDLVLEVEFMDGKARDVRYRHEDGTIPFSDEEVAALLEKSAAGKLWRRTTGDRWELDAPAIAEATISHITQTAYFPDGTQAPRTDRSFRITSTEKQPLSTWLRGALAETSRFLTGGERRAVGILEFKPEEDDHVVAILRQGNVVFEIPWIWPGNPGKAQLRAGTTYEVTIREEDPVDLDRIFVFVSDRVHASHGARVVDSDGWFTLVRIKEGHSVIYDEAVCEVHRTRMEWKSAAIGYGMYAPAMEADAFCDQHYPHHASWIRGGCVVDDVKTAFHYVCRQCVAAAEKYKREGSGGVTSSTP